eukprot:CAMPEP_0179057532 /NCGR_PEP_ID=MMETSP0796-20121207/24382_1 /TAXON_ID=73915 /ORGANISM="Pyrodinium bahamense, Strain pbaha01" /LENGTH=342 /DNA_ID=CAMNT_0020754253 /DNA_START=267 /DNA_END=1295 /DNA_ORIENTATION=-
MAEYMSLVYKLNADVADFEKYVGFFRFYLSSYNLLLVLRCFKAFESQPRLAIIMNTLVEALPDFLHFMFVFCTMLVAFASAAVFLFGHRLPEFSHLGFSMERCLLILFGRIEYDKLAGEHPGTAFLWFLAYTTLMYMIMLNMCLAVIVDVYCGQMSTAVVAESMGEQLLRIWKPEGIPTRDVLQAVEESDSEEWSRTALLEACPNMGEKQAHELIQRVAAVEDNEDDARLTITHATKLIVSVKGSVKRVAHDVNALIHSHEGNRRELEVLMAELGAGDGEPLILLHPQANKRLKDVEHRLDALEDILNDAMRYTENRGKVLRDRLKAVEEQLRGRRNATSEH